MTKAIRVHRSELAVPGSNMRMLTRAPLLGADVVMLDLEDAVAPADKVRARAQVVQALERFDWSTSAVSLRINGLDTEWCYRDVIEVIESAGAEIDTLLGACRPGRGRRTDHSLG